MPSLEDTMKHGRRVVISGMSGLFPGCRNVKEFSDILYNKEYPITAEPRWQYDHPEIVKYVGKVPELDLFDAQFFRVHYRLSLRMDPMSRKILEHAYQAIFDAGVSPQQLNGKKIAIYLGCGFSETEKASFADQSSRNGFGLTGCNKSMFANRVSYWLNAKGPSLCIDQACCSSFAALEAGYQAILHGDCEAAVVAASSLCLHPQCMVHYNRLLTLSPDGKTRSFDTNANGCVRSEAVSVLFLQKADDALRIYAEIVHVKSRFTSLVKGDTGPKYGFYRNPSDTINFLKQFYNEANVAPQTVHYVEAFGCGIPDADKAELEALGEVFCEERKEPLFVGSVTSNIGYSESATGLSAVAKVLLGYNNGKVASNLHCESPRQDVDVVRDGRIQIVTDHEPMDQSYAAVNGYSYNGVNAHVLLKGHNKPKDPNRYKSNIPYLVTVSGRQESSVDIVLQDLKSRPLDPEELALLHNIHETRVSAHLGRGFIILDTNDAGETFSLCETKAYFDDAKRPLWFVYSGMGSQWAGMGAQLMRIPTFAASVQRCHAVLKPKGIDLINIITSPDPTIFDNILNSFVGNAAVQIGLTDILRELQILPDKVIGHSVGELGCAYADGCFTAEEMILVAYSRGLVSVQTPFIAGSMAAVGMGHQEITKLLPPEIEVACHNSATSCTISGPTDIMKSFVAELTAKNIFAKEVACSNIAYHSRYIADAGPDLLKHLNEIIKEPKLRTERWVSTSVPQEQWNEPAALYCSAEYHTNNLLVSYVDTDKQYCVKPHRLHFEKMASKYVKKPVLFEEASELVPPTAVLVEIAPHGLLQAILKRSLPASCKNLSLTQRGSPDSVCYLLKSIGELYMTGLNPVLKALYPKIDFPVSTGTPMLSHLVDWVHDEKWSLPLFVSADKIVAASCKFLISVHDDEHVYLKGHVIRGTNVYPFSSALVAVWDTLAMSLGYERKKVSVQFTELRFNSQPVLNDRRLIDLNVTLQRGSGRFEVWDGITEVINGFIKAIEKPKQPTDVVSPVSKPDAEVALSDEKSDAEVALLGNKSDAGVASSEQKLDVNVALPVSAEDEALSDKELTFNAEDIYKLLYIKDYNYVGDFRSIHSANESLTKAKILWRGSWDTYIDGIFQMNFLRQPHNTVSQLKYIKTMEINVDNHLKDNDLMESGSILLNAHIDTLENTIRCGGVLIGNIGLQDLPKLSNVTETMDTLQFIPHFSTNIIDEATVLDVYLQEVAENTNKDVINITKISNSHTDDITFQRFNQILRKFTAKKIKFRVVNRSSLLKKASLENMDLILVENLSTDNDMCRTLYTMLNINTFVINKEDHSNPHSVPRPSLLYRIISAHSTGSNRIELIRWKPTSDTNEISAISVNSSSDLPMLLSTIANISDTHNLLVFSCYPPLPMLKDIVKDYRKRTNKNISLIMVNESSNQFKSELGNPDLAFSVVVDDVIGGEYHLPIKQTAAVECMRLENTSVGDVKSLKWVEVPAPTGPGIQVTVHYAGLSIVDAKKNSGAVKSRKREHQNVCGMEFSGIVDSTGSRVMGLIESGAVNTKIRVHPNMLWPVPKHWSLEDAATVPLAYCLALYCLSIRSHLYSGMRILVHGGAGALGQAVISVALAHGCEVFTTVSSTSKKAFLRRLFPELRDDHIGYSRNDSFTDMVLTVTNGEGCDIVMSCVKGELRSSTLKCCGLFGVIIDTTLLQDQEDYDLGMNFMIFSRSFTMVDITSLFSSENIEVLKRLQLLVSEGLSRGYVRPASRVVYAAPAAARALRLLAASRHRGRVLLRLEQPPAVGQARLKCSSDLNHLIVSDDDMLGIQLADMLVSRGAQKLFLQWRKTSSTLEFKARSWEQMGVNVNVIYEDISDADNARKLLERITEIRAIEGIYVIAIDANYADKMETVMERMDLTKEKFNSHLKYSTIIRVDGENKEKRCNFETPRDDMPIRVLLPKLNAINDVFRTERQDGISVQNAIDAVEFILSAPRAAVALTWSTEKKSILQQIFSVSGLDKDNKIDINDLDLSKTINDLRVDTLALEAIQALLSDHYNISRPLDNIRSLSLKEIVEMEKEILSHADYKETPGLWTFLSYLDKDELQASNQMLFMPTLIRSAALNSYEFDPNETYLCAVAGAESHSERFRGVCARLKLPALALLPGFERLETFGETAQRFVQMMPKNAMEASKRFYLLGYESGVMTALEMAAILEEKGWTGTVYCIGGSPEEICKVINNKLKEYVTEKALQIAVVKHMSTLMTKTDTKDLECVLNNSLTWKERVDCCIRDVKGRVSYSNQFIREVIESTYARLADLRRYKPKPKAIKSQLVSLRSKSVEHVSMQDYSQKPVIEYDLDVPFAYLMRDSQCASIINRHLDKDILEKIENANLCDTYILNDVFMSNI